MLEVDAISNAMVPIISFPASGFASEYTRKNPTFAASTASPNSRSDTGPSADCSSFPFFLAYMNKILEVENNPQNLKVQPALAFAKKLTYESLSS